MTSNFRFAPLVLTALAGAGFAAFMASSFVNFPVGDDFKAIFPIAMEAKEYGWQALTFDNVAAQHFSHRIVAARVLAVLQTLLFGGVNFLVFMWCGLLMWVALFLLLGARKGWLMSTASGAAAALVWFQPQAASNLQVAMQAVQNIGVVLLAVMAFGLRARQGGWSAAAAWSCGLLAWFTAGNGILVALFLLVWEVWERKWLRAGGGLVVSLLAGFIYFRGFANPENQTYGFDVWQLLGNALVMLGSIFRFGTAPLAVAFVCGTVLALGGGWLLWSRVRAKDFFGAACLLFIFGSVAMASLARLGWGFEYMTQGRYKIYAIMLLAMLLGHASLRATSNRLAVVAALVTASGFAAASWWQYGSEVATTSRMAAASAMSYHLGEPALFVEGEEALAVALHRLDAAVQSGLYAPPLANEARLLASSVGEVLPSSTVSCRYEQAVTGFVVKVAGPQSSPYLLCRTQGRTGSRVAVRPMMRLALGSLWRGRRADQTVTYLMPQAAEGQNMASPPSFFTIGASPKP